MDNCVFCQIVQGQLPGYKIYEDDQHLAFLSIYPNTDGFAVVITKDHFSSYFADNKDEIISNLIIAAKKVAKKIDNAFDDVGRTGLIFEGFGVDHLHLKLFPMHGTKTDNWKQYNSQVDKFFTVYEGYISSHNGPRAQDDYLKKIADKINHG